MILLDIKNTSIIFIILIKSISNNIDDFVNYFDNHDVVIGPPIHDSAFHKKFTLNNMTMTGF